jgi:hypothetical protein
MYQEDLNWLRDQAEQCFSLARRRDLGDAARVAIEEIGHSLVREVCRLEGARQKASPPPQHSAPVRGCVPKISDDDLLTLIDDCGRVGDLAVLHRTLTEQMDDNVDLNYLLARLDRLCQIGALRILEPSADGILQFELTERGARTRKQATVRVTTELQWARSSLCFEPVDARHLVTVVLPHIPRACPVDCPPGARPGSKRTEPSATCDEAC